MQRCKSLIQEFWVNLLYIKGESNVVAYTFSRLPMAHQVNKLSYINLEEDTCEIVCLDSLFISDDTDCFFLDMEYIYFSVSSSDSGGGI